VDINNIYVTNVTKVAVVHKNGPPPVKPVIPVSKKAFDSDPKLAKKFNPKDSDVLVTPTGGLKVAPSRIQDIASKRMTIDDIKRISAEPSSFDRDRKVMPTSLDRDKNIDISSPSIRDRKRLISQLIQEVEMGLDGEFQSPQMMGVLILTGLLLQ